MIEHTEGNLLQDATEALVNTVNKEPYYGGLARRDSVQGHA